MAINQPPITGDPVVDAWMLEVTRELNGGTGVASVAPTTTTVTGSSPIQTVDQSGILRLNQGQLSNADVVTDVTFNGTSVVTGGVAALTSQGTGLGVSLTQNDYSMTIPNPAVTSYNFTSIMSSDLDNGNIPETHMVFLGGLRLCEGTGRDYTRSGTTIILMRTSQNFQSIAGLNLTLTIFRAT